MVNFLYQEFIIFLDYTDDLFDMCANIYYTNYSIVLLCNDKTKIKENHNDFITILPIVQSKNQTILNYCENISPNSNILITNALTGDFLTELNTLFLENQIRLILNEKIFAKSYIKPEYWCCKCGILQEIKKQINDNLLEKLEMPLCAIDIAGTEKVHYYTKIRTVHNNILSLNLSRQMRGEYIDNTIHIILATFNRNKNLERVFEMIKSQTKQNIHLHLIDNNTEPNLQTEIDHIIEQYKELIQISLHRYNYNYHCISRLRILKDLYNRTLIEYIILFDDDQLYDNEWIELYINSFKPLTVHSWYGKIFEKCDYWNTGAKYDNILTYGDLEFKRKLGVKKFTYFGPGGSILDANLVLFNELFEFEKYSEFIYKMDDIWMSFAFDKYLSIPFNRIPYHPKECIDRNIPGNMTWTTIKTEKEELFKQLSHDFQWDVVNKNDNLKTVNNMFDIVYVIYTNEDQFIPLRDLFIKQNICAKFIHYTDKIEIILRVFQTAIECNQKQIVIFDENTEFHPFFHHRFDKNIRQVPTNWNVVHFGNDCDNIEAYSKKTSDVIMPSVTAYSIDAMEIILALKINGSNVFENNKLIEHTNIKEQYIINSCICNKI